MIKSSPQRIIARGTDGRFLNDLKRELKGVSERWAGQGDLTLPKQTRRVVDNLLSGLLPAVIASGSTRPLCDIEWSELHAGKLSSGGVNSVQHCVSVLYLQTRNTVSLLE